MPDLGSLHFLAPWAGGLALLIGAPILLLFYFLKLRRRPVRVSSAMLWRDAARDLQVNVPWRLIRPSWLLVLQILILALIAGALARPVLDVPSAPPGRLVIVIDHSASMNATDRPGASTRLDDAKERAAELLRRVQGGQTEVAIMTFAARAAVRYAFATDLGAAGLALRSIEPTDEPGDLAEALRLIAPMTAQGDDDPEALRGAVRVVLFSDGGDASRLEAASAQPIAGLGAVDVEFIRVGPPADNPTANTGIISVAARRDYEDPAIVRVFAAVEHHGREARSTFLRASLEGAEVGSWPIALSAATPEGPGQATKTFELISPGGGLLKLEIGDGDALPADDAAWITLQPPARPVVWLVRPESAAETAASASLREAIESIGEVDLRVMTGSEYETLAGAAPSQGLVVFDGVRPTRVPVTPSISFGEGLPIAGLIVERPETTRPTQVAFWVRSHPLLRGVTFPGTTMHAPRRVILPDPNAPESRVREAQVLARGADGPLIAEIADNARRVILAFTIDESNWWKDPSFPVFIANAVESLTGGGAESAGLIVRTGRPVTVPRPAASGEILITGPGGKGLERRVTVGDDGQLALGSLPRAGVYSIGDGARIGVSVLDAVETALATRETLTIGGRPVAGTGVERLAPREVWHWFVIAAVALLAIEWWAYALRMRT